RAARSYGRRAACRRVRRGSLVYALRWLGAVAAVFAAVGLAITVPAAANNPHAGQVPHVEYCHSWPGYTHIHWDRNELQARFGTGVVNSVGIHWHGPFQGDFIIFKMDNENFSTVTPIGALWVDSFTLALDNGVRDTFDTNAECK